MDFFKQKWRSLLGIRFTSKKEFADYFFSLSDHAWILENRQLKRAFEYLIEDLSEEEINQMMRSGEVYFVRVNDRLSCTVRADMERRRGNQVVLVFPRLYNLLKSAAPDFGLAVLCHEIAHIVLDHSHKRLSPLQKQVEADRFALEHGFGLELVELLEEEGVAHPEVQLRLKKLLEHLEDEEVAA